jgi:hypothetical protein
MQRRLVATGMVAVTGRHAADDERTPGRRSKSCLTWRALYAANEDVLGMAGKRIDIPRGDR